MICLIPIFWFSEKYVYLKGIKKTIARRKSSVNCLLSQFTKNEENIYKIKKSGLSINNIKIGLNIIYLSSYSNF